MRVLISSVGTRGDVQPVLALAVEVRRLGLQTRLCLSPNFVAWAAELGLEARPVGVAMRPADTSAPSSTALPVDDLITEQFDALGAAAEDCELIVGAGMHQYAARSVAEQRGLPYVAAVYAPTSLPSPETIPPGYPDKVSAPTACLAFWSETRRSWNARSLRSVNANRARLALAPVGDVLDYLISDSPWLAADPLLAPLPPTLAMRVVQTGDWRLPDSSKLDADLEHFLSRGDPPIYVGFGSMPAPKDISRMAVEAVRALGRRSVLSRGWATLESIDDAPDCIMIESANHEALFPRVAAVVHHGGAGTTAAAARAGVPQVIAPMFSDQFYWSRRARDLGLGTAIPMAELTVSALSSALRCALDPSVTQRAAVISRDVRSDGAQIAARLLAEQCR